MRSEEIALKTAFKFSNFFKEILTLSFCGSLMCWDRALWTDHLFLFTSLLAQHKHEWIPEGNFFSS